MTTSLHPAATVGDPARGSEARPTPAAHRATWALTLHGIFEWITWVMIVNALWWLFSAAGLFIAGCAPATFAAAELTRRKLRGDAFPPLQAFARTWLQSFGTANLSAAPLTVATLMLGTNLIAFGATAPLLLRVATLVALVATLTVATTLPAMHAHYDLPRRAYLPTSLRWSARNLPGALLIAVTLVLVATASRALPGLVPFVSVGAFLTIATALNLSFFDRNDRQLAAA